MDPSINSSSTYSSVFYASLILLPLLFFSLNPSSNHILLNNPFIMFGGYFQHKKDIGRKRLERQQRIEKLKDYNTPITADERELLNESVEEVVGKVKAGTLSPQKILQAYGKRALQAQADTNCITEVLIQDAEDRIYLDTVPTDGPLAGFPISLKDTHHVKGFDSTIGYTANAFKPASEDSPIVRLLRDAGAVPFVKTNVPYTMLSFECYNDLWGITENPHVQGYAAGGSTGGEACLLAYGGSRIGVGTDVAGSVRLPAHFSGCYALKCSTGRFPKIGNTTSMAGQEGIPAVYSPMARTLGDLSYFLKAVISMKPWNYDYTVNPMPWKEDTTLPKKAKVGVIYNDGVVTPSPACRRALDQTVDALRAKGHDVVTFDAPDPLRALRIASQLLVSDACKVALRKQRSGENNDWGVARFVAAARLPRWMKRVYAWYLENIKGDHVWATLVRDWNEKTITERWDLVAEREGYKAEFFDAWKRSGIDFLITVPNATPAFPHYGLYESVSSCGYTFMFNLLDYAAGVLPVTKVDKALDAVDAKFKPSNRVEAGAYHNYDAVKMHGLPVGVQVVAGRLEEEKALLAMELVEKALNDAGNKYELLNE